MERHHFNTLLLIGRDRSTSCINILKYKYTGSLKSSIHSFYKTHFLLLRSQIKAYISHKSVILNRNFHEVCTVWGTAAWRNRSHRKKAQTRAPGEENGQYRHIGRNKKKCQISNDLCADCLLAQGHFLHYSMNYQQSIKWDTLYLQLIYHVRVTSDGLQGLWTPPMCNT